VSFHSTRCRGGLASAALFALMLAACTTVPPQPIPPPAPPVPVPAPVLPPPPPAEAPTLSAPQAAGWNQLPGWSDDAIAQAWPAFQQSCKSLARQPAWQGVCAAAESVDGQSNDAVRAWFERNFTPYAFLRSDGKDGLVTGYYEPLVRGSRMRSAAYPAPLYGLPDDLLVIDLADVYPDLKGMRLRGRIDDTGPRRRVIPYWSRADIDTGRAPLAGRELIWVDNAVEAFFLQIQGSGRVLFEDGTMVRVAYADQNGHPYRSIGRLLVDRGDLPLERASMQGIKAWGQQHPEQLPALLEENPSYVFFRELALPASGPDGPPGALGVPLTAGRSLAVDPKFAPLGAPIFLSTTWPNTSRPLGRLMFAQDTGGAIRGPLRADFFWGFGSEAATQAGRMKQPGQMWLLWPAGAPLPPVAGGKSAEKPKVD
jgi:membrane-bound lytic murein transglycosylase A